MKAYLDLLQDVLDNGVEKKDRTLVIEYLDDLDKRLTDLEKAAKKKAP